MHETRRDLMIAGRVAVCAALAALPAAAQGQTASPRIHEPQASASTVHRGFFDASLKPILTIGSGDIVRLETASGNPRWFENLGVPKEKIPAELYAAYEGFEGSGRGDHNLSGPIVARRRLHGRERGDGLGGHAGSRWHEGHPRPDAQGDFPAVRGPAKAGHHVRRAGLYGPPGAA
jgi:hypothetical protein